VRNDTHTGGGCAGERRGRKEKKQIKPEQRVKRCPAPHQIQRLPPSPPQWDPEEPAQRGRGRADLKRNPAGGEETEAQRSDLGRAPGGAWEGTVAAEGTPPVVPHLPPPEGQTPARPYGREAMR
jgi:hypothetical protein